MPYGGAPYGGAPYGGSPPSGPPPVTGTVTFAATGGFEATAGILVFGTVEYAATASFSGTGTVTHTEPSVFFDATGGLTADGTVTGPPELFVAATARFIATGSTSGDREGTVVFSASAEFTATGNTPPPIYSPIGDTHTIKYWLTTLDPQAFGSQSIFYPIAELPFTQVTFSKCFNQAGPFSATLNIEDDQVLNTNWIAATNPGKCFFWVLVDNQLVYGGRILNRSYQMSAQQVTITGLDFYSYWTQRLQAMDYTAYVQHYSGATSQIYSWANIGLTVGAGAPPPFIAWQILQDAAAVTGQLPNLQVPFHGEGVGTKSDPDYWVANYPPGAENFITFTAPLSQQQTIDSLLQQMIAMGYMVGVDVVTDVQLGSRGNPGATTNVCWPRYGKTAAEQGVNMQVMDLSTVIDFEWSEDATAQATGIVELTGAGGVTASAVSIDDVALDTYNYPLLEQSVCHTAMSPTALNAQVLATLLKGDRDLYAYPQLAPVVTVPIFNYGTGFSLTALPMGDDIGVFNPYERQGLYGLPSIPFPPKGSPCVTPDGEGHGVMRVVRADVTIADDGVSTMELTLNPPPGNPSPPGYN